MAELAAFAATAVGATETAAAINAVAATRTFASAASALSSIGTGLGLVSTLQNANATRAANKANAQIAENNAKIAESQTAAAVEKQRREGLLRQGAARAAAASRGTGIGSAYDILADNAAQEELDVLTIKHQGLLRKTGYLQDAALETASGKAVKKNTPYLLGGQLLTSSSKFGTGQVV